MRWPLLLPLVVGLVMACDGDAELLSPTDSAPAAQADAPATASPTPDTAAPTPAPLTPSPTPTAQPFAPTHHIANTGGVGVAVRDGCRDDARVSAPGAGIPEQTMVQLLATSGDCPGWTRVVTEEGRQTWIRLRYLASADPFTWPGDIATATWRDITAALGAEGPACAAAALASHGAGAGVLQRPVLAPDVPAGSATPAWLAAIAPCIGHDLAAEVFVAGAADEFGPLGAAATRCVRSFVAEIFAIDPPAIVVDDLAELSSWAPKATVARSHDNVQLSARIAAPTSGCPSPAKLGADPLKRPSTWWPPSSSHRTR